MADIQQLIDKFVAKNDPQYTQVTELMWQYLLMEAASSVPSERLRQINTEILEISHTSPLTREEILIKFYPQFFSDIEIHINKFFTEYV